MKRTLLSSLIALTTATLLVAAAHQEPAPPRAAHPNFKIVEATIPEMRAAMEQGRLTSRELILQYLARIAMYEDRLNAAIAKESTAEHAEHAEHAENF